MRPIDNLMHNLFARYVDTTMVAIASRVDFYGVRLPAGSMFRRNQNQLDPWLDPPT